MDITYEEENHEVVINSRGEHGGASYGVAWNDNQATMIIDMEEAYNKYTPRADVHISSHEMARFYDWRRGEVVRKIHVLSNSKHYTLDFIPIDDNLPFMAFKSMPTLPMETVSRYMISNDVLWEDDRPQTPTREFWEEWTSRMTQRRSDPVLEPPTRYINWKEAEEEVARFGT